MWFSPVYFRKVSEPYMTMAIAHVGRKPGVTVAEVNLKLIWDVVSNIKIGKEGYAYVVDPDGRLIAHPDISLVLRNTDLSGLPQVASALAAGRRPGHRRWRHYRAQLRGRFGVDSTRGDSGAQLAGLRRAARQRGAGTAL